MVVSRRISLLIVTLPNKLDAGMTSFHTNDEQMSNCFGGWAWSPSAWGHHRWWVPPPRTLKSFGFWMGFWGVDCVIAKKKSRGIRVSPKISMSYYFNLFHIWLYGCLARRFAVGWWAVMIFFRRKFTACIYPGRVPEGLVGEQLTGCRSVSFTVEEVVIRRWCKVVG